MVERNNLNPVTNPEEVLRTVVPGVKAKDYKVNHFYFTNFVAFLLSKSINESLGYTLFDYDAIFDREEGIALPVNYLKFLGDEFTPEQVSNASIFTVKDVIENLNNSVLRGAVKSANLQQNAIENIANIAVMYTVNNITKLSKLWYVSRKDLKEMNKVGGSDDLTEALSGIGCIYTDLLAENISIRDKNFILWQSSLSQYLQQNAGDIVSLLCDIFDSAVPNQNDFQLFTMVERNNLNPIINPEEVLRTVVPGVKVKDYKVNHFYFTNFVAFLLSKSINESLGYTLFDYDAIFDREEGIALPVNYLKFLGDEFTPEQVSNASIFTVKDVIENLNNSVLRGAVKSANLQQNAIENIANIAVMYTVNNITKLSKLWYVSRKDLKEMNKVGGSDDLTEALSGIGCIYTDLLAENISIRDKNFVLWRSGLSQYLQQNVGDIASLLCNIFNL